MKAFFIFLTFSFFTTSIFGQQCICNKELNFVIKYYEANLPSFSDNVNQTNRKEYEKFKMNLLKQTVGITGKSECFKLLTYYVEYFKDNHSGVYMQNKKVYEKDPNSVSEFLNSEPFTSREIIKLKQSDNKQFKLNDIKGIYQSTDSLFKIVIVPNKNSLRDFVGVVIETKTPLWKVGQ
ncbi:MAG: hypothetical protein IPP72_13750 [Chitinophagaceae bacterium]|nr:hypothetical protein [Chitinophagaceae bacterium]